MIAPHHQAEWDAFVRSVLDTPDDALPRMLLSDWCEQNGYDAEAACLREKRPRLPIDEWTARACAELYVYLPRSRFVVDVCLGVQVFGVEPMLAPPWDDPSIRGTFLVNCNDRLSPKQLAAVWGIILQRRRRCGPELVQRARIVLPERLARLHDPTSACSHCGGTRSIDYRPFDGKSVGSLVNRICQWCGGDGRHSPLPRTIGVEA